MSARRHLGTLVALFGIASLSWLVLTYRPSGMPFARDPSRLSVWAFILPLLAVGIGLVRNTQWATNLGIAIGLAVLPWAAVLTFTPSLGAPVQRQVVALVGASCLLAGLLPTSRARIDERHTAPADVVDRAARWIRACFVFNLVSALNLYAFLIGYSFGASWQLVVFGVLLLGLLIGLALLVRNVTGGLLVLAVSAVLMVPGAFLFVVAEASSGGEAVLFAVLFAPGVIAALGTVALLARPLSRVLRDTA